MNVSEVLRYLWKTKYAVSVGNCLYHDEKSYSGKCGVFFKRSRYSNQNKFRINLSCEAFKQQVEDCKTIQKEKEKRNGYIQTTLDTQATKEARFFASEELTKAELKIEELKSKFYEPIDMQEDFLSDIMPISLLFATSSIYQWQNDKDV